MLFILLVSIVAVLIFYWIKTSLKNLSYWKQRGVRYVKPVPFFGNLLPNVTKSMSMSDLIYFWYNAFPDERYIGLYQFEQPVLLIRDPELIKSLTIKNFEHFVDHTGFIPVETDPLWGKNLFSVKGERWRDLRQTLSPVFTSSKMRTMFVLMEECAKQLVQHYSENNNDIIHVELRDVFTRYTNDIIASTAFGIKCDSLKNKDNEFLSAARELADVSGLKRFKFLLYGSNPKLCKLLGIKIITNRVGNFFKSIISETIKLRESNQVIRPDLIHSLMLARKGKLKYEDYLNIPEAGFAAVKESEIGKSNDNNIFLTDEDITAQAILFFLGGFDTVASVTSFAVYELAVNQHIQKKLKEEVASTSRECNNQITYEKLLGMKYLDMVVCETLRLWGQATWLDRKCTKPFEILPERDGESVVKLNEGDVCWIPTFGIHRDAKYYPNPDVFDPERFSDENKDKIVNSTYLPFGMGPRNCIGSRYALLAAKILLYYLFLNYDFVTTSKTQIPLKTSANTTFLQPEGGFHIGLKPNKIKS